MQKGIPHISNLADIPKENIFKVPDSYFERLPHTLVQKPILGLNENLQKTSFQVPNTYFEELYDRINDRIDEQAGLQILSANDHPFKVPDQYFETLASKLDHQILPVAPTLPSPMEMPENYFDTLSEKIHERIEGKSEAKVLSLYPEIRRYAVAASVILLLSLAFYFYQKKPLQQQNEIAKVETITPNTDLAQSMIASLSKADVKLYLEQQEDVEHQELLEYTSSLKKEKIQAAFEKEILPLKIKKQERQDLELELENIDMSDIESDI